MALSAVLGRGDAEGLPELLGLPADPSRHRRRVTLGLAVSVGGLLSPLLGTLLYEPTRNGVPHT